MSLKLYLLSRPTFDIDELSRFLQTESVIWRRTPGATTAEELIEIAGRTCYMSFGDAQSPRTNSEFIENIIEMDHESVLEHVSWTILLTGVSRAFTHQLVRHRVGFAFSQLSQQYHDETEATFVMPPELTGIPDAAEAWSKAIATTLDAYRVLQECLRNHQRSLPEDLNRKELNRAIRSAARSVLPNATETKIVVTVNARALRHFLKVRGSIPGDREMREVASALFRMMQTEAPAVLHGFWLDQLSDGSPIIRHGDDHSPSFSVGKPIRRA